MRRTQEIAAEKTQMATLMNLTSVFESLASMKISQIKNQVLASQVFFSELWHIYQQIRVDSLFRLGRIDESEHNNKVLFIGITGEGGFSGDIDQRLVKWMLTQYDKEKHEIVIVGHHGATQLAQAGVSFVRYFKMPSKDENINVRPLVDIAKKYKQAAVFYQSYVSLMVQDIKRIDLTKAVEDQGTKTQKDSDEIINEDTYIFEPTTFEVVAHLEGSMMQIALTQCIFESKLAQYASRFRAMSAARENATTGFNELQTIFNRTKRAIADERLKETINGFRQVGRS